MKELKRTPSTSELTHLSIDYYTGASLEGVPECDIVPVRVGTGLMNIHIDTLETDNFIELMDYEPETVYANLNDPLNNIWFLYDIDQYTIDEDNAQWIEGECEYYYTYGDSYFTCERCDEAHDNGVQEYHDHTAMFVCRDCYDILIEEEEEEANNTPIKSYHDNDGFYIKSLNTSSTSYKNSTACSIGFELEIDGGDDEESCAQDLLDVLAPDIHCEYDGSIPQGFEIVSQPMTVDYLSQFDIEKLCSIARTHDFKSHDTTTCGLHIHLNRKWYGLDKTAQAVGIYNLLTLIERFYDSHLVRFSRRDYSKLDEWAKKPEMGYYVKAGDHDEMESIVYSKGYASRYTALNLTNYATVEFRLFRGTLKPSTIRASYQLCVALSLYANKHDLTACNTVSFNKIIAWYCDQPDSEHQELVRYLIERKMLPLDFTPSDWRNV